MTKCFSYLRTSSQSNVGNDKDSGDRQRAAIGGYAAAHGFEIVREFYDQAVSGADPVTERPGFMEMLQGITGNGVRVILCESPDRFARDLMVQLSGHAKLKELGVTLIPVSSPDHFLSDTPTAIMVRQILGAVAEFEKAALVAKLASGRRKVAMTKGKCGGARSFGEKAAKDADISDAMAKARELRGNGRSLRAISAELARGGHLSSTGKPFTAQSVKSMTA